MKPTKKFIAAKKIALEIGVEIDDNIYQNLKEQGFTWFNKAGEWLTEKHRDPFPPVIEIRVTSNKKTIEEDCSDIIDCLSSCFTAEGISKAYSCRPPNQNKANIYLTFFRAK